MKLWKRFSRASLFAIGAGVALPVLADTAPRITEFLAQNDGLLRDEDGESPDWIELQNPSPAPLNLGGWHLTDDPARPDRWTFPATNLAPGAFLVVFASGKDRALAGAELHTNFRLNDAGGYLGLVAPDGATVAQAFHYPAQRRNVSFGSGRVVSTNLLLGPGAAARLWVPAQPIAGLEWTLAGYDDSAWLGSNTPVGFRIAASTEVVLAVDFNARSANLPGNTQSGFASFAANGTGIQTTPVTRTFGALSVTVSNNSSAYGYDDRLRATPTDSGALTESLLLRDFIFSRDNTSTNGLDVWVTGLAPGQEYQATVWSFDSGSPGNRVSDWYANGLPVASNYTFNGSVLPAANTNARFGFAARADAQGRLWIAGRRDPASVDAGGAASFGVFLNALQLSRVLPPTPPTNGLASLMVSNNATCLIRLPFTVADAGSATELQLRVRYDDGFAAYINGQLLAMRNAPGALTWNATATASHADSLVEELILPLPAGLLANGTNVLALHGLNVAVEDPDFTLAPELSALQVAEMAERYFSPPTPGAPNALGFEGLVADTKFSVNRGFYDAPFWLSITCATAGAEIRFTTNGSPPTATSGAVFTTPILITGQSFVRAAAFKPGLVPTDVDTHSYIFLRDVLRQSNNIPGYPTNWQAGYPADYAMDPEIVSHPVYGATISNDLRSLPSLCLVTDHAGFWSSSTGIYPNSTAVGPAWERATSIELIEGDGRTAFATTCRIQIHGNASRDNQRTPKHAFGLTFSSDYGPSKLRYDWFSGGVTTFDKIVLRCCGFVDGWAGRYADENLYTSTETGETFRGLRYRPENTCYLRDAWVKDSFRDMGWAASRTAYTHLYINGLYWGLYQPSERLDASYFSRLLGGLEGAWDVIVGEDNNGPPVLVDGSLADWQEVLNLVNAGITNEAAYQAVAQRVDLENLADYMILHIFAESEDWPRHNWYVAHRRATNGVSGTKFICSVWDQELTLDRLVRRNRVEVGGSGGEVYSPARLYQRLRAWPEFRRLFGDRVQKHLFNNGALTPSNNIARLLGPAARIREALVGESARWGDARKYPTPGGPNGTGKTFTRDEWWQPEIDKLVTNFFPKLTADNVARFRAANLYPALGAPQFSRFGGAVEAGFALGMSHTNVAGTIYFTVDGTDPRQYGTGAVAPSAQAYEAPVLLNGPTLVRARVLQASQWSALVEAMFYPPQDLSGLVMTELMYHPVGQDGLDGDEFEFLEMKNTGSNTLNLSGLALVEGIRFTFTNGFLLDPGAFVVLVRNPSAFGLRYPGVTVAGVYSGRLDNAGERLTLAHPAGGAVFSLAYSDAGPWPVTPDGFGFSLVRKNPLDGQAPEDGARWRASRWPGGSPGADDPWVLVAPLYVNEVLSASAPPQVDAVELYNPLPISVDLSGDYLTDDASQPFKYRLPEGTWIEANGYLVLDERHFNTTPGTNNSFAFNGDGEEVYYFGAEAQGQLTGYSHGFGFAAAEPGVSFGRYVTSTGEEHFPAQAALTLGRTNTRPRVGPVVINEIHYHPTNGGVEFVELKNIAQGDTPLYDVAFPTNTWRLEGAGFDFPPGIEIPAGGFVLVTATNPAAFRALHSVPDTVLVFGPWAGALQNSGELISLTRPGLPGSNGVAFIVVDQVRYNDKSPWPPAADGSGDSLQRIEASAYGNDPINWQAAPPTPGTENPPGGPDSDGDGMPDAWEFAHGFQPWVSDGDADADLDSLTNLQEYLAGTDPTDPASRLELQVLAALDSGAVILHFHAVPGRSYSLLGSDDGPGGPWFKLQDLPPGSESRVCWLTNTLLGSSSRFFRLTTPAQP